MLDKFDVAIEISRKKLLNYILENVTVNSLPIVPKFILKTSNNSASLQAILDSVDLKLVVGTNKALLVYHVFAATVSLPNQTLLGFSDGEIHFNLMFTPGSPLKAIFQSAEFTTNQTSLIVDPTAFFSAVNNLLTGWLDTTTEWDLFPGTPTDTQIMMLGLVLNGQIACLDANTVVAAIGSGDITKVTNFLKLEDFGVALSVDRVKNTILFPSEISLLSDSEIANDLNMSPADVQKNLQNPTLNFINSLKPNLPAPFGSGAAKQTVNGVDLFYDFIDFGLGNGVIKMNGMFHGETFCTHIHNGSFSEDIFLKMVNQQIQVSFVPNPPVPTYSAEFDFWCGLGFIFLASNVALVTGIVVTSILISVVTSIKVQQNNLGTNAKSVPGFDQVSWNDVKITTEGMILLGTSTAAVGYDTTISRVDIDSKLVNTNVEDCGSGIYHFLGTQVCKAQEFQYEEYRQDVVLTLTPKATDILFPVKTTWIIHNQAVTSGSGQIIYNDLAHTATPPFNEAQLPNHQIIIEYSVLTGGIIIVKPFAMSNLQLTLPKSDYNFYLYVELKVEDAAGYTYSCPFGLDVQTDVLQFGQDFIDFQKQCGLATKIRLGDIKTIPQGVLHRGDPLTVEQVAQVIREVVNVQPLDAVDIMKSFSETFGSRAVLKTFSPPAGLKTKIRG